MKIKRGWDETRDLLARTSQLCGLSDRQSFPLMVFCSGCIFLTIAASFFTVSSFDRPVRLLLNFCKRSLLVMGFLVRYHLTASSVIPWGPSSLPVGVGVLVLEPPPAPPAEGAGDTRGFCLLDFPLRLGYLFWLHLLDASMILLPKPRQFKKLFQHGEHETDREEMKHLKR